MDPIFNCYELLTLTLCRSRKNTVSDNISYLFQLNDVQNEHYGDTGSQIFTTILTYTQHVGAVG